MPDHAERIVFDASLEFATEDSLRHRRRAAGDDE